MTAHARPGFSLIELLVVISIIALLMGMMTYDFARVDLRRQAVKTAAEELASTFRQARTLAMERKGVHAVVFHIQNQPGSSGLVLNNRSGGHWYRILGPSTFDSSTRAQLWDDLPQIARAGDNTKPHSVFEIAELINRAWADESHVLPAGKVRFLALSDMDYGDTPNVQGNYRTIATHDSYPRPWFGWYDESNKRLYPWGGYEAGIPGSGFYYWGETRTSSGVTYATRDPVAPSTSVHTSTRALDHWEFGQTNFNWDQSLPVPSSLGTDIVYKAGDQRPLIDADLRDCAIVFLSTGEVRWGYWMPARHHPYMWNGKNSGTGVTYSRGVGDRCNGTGGTWPYEVKQHTETEAGCFDQDNAGWYITMAPDSPDDNDRFGSAKEALASISPMYRVFISRLGETTVVPVSKSEHFNGLSAFPANATWWRTVNNMRLYFPADRHVDGTVLGGSNQGLGVVQGRPITDFVTPTMLSERQVWMK